jgi:hypothetical protein
MTVYEYDNPNTVEVKKIENAISPEEAAQIGALYIWEMFGESINGMAVEISYHSMSHFTKAFWLGHVAESKGD